MERGTSGGQQHQSQSHHQQQSHHQHQQQQQQHHHQQQQQHQSRHQHVVSVHNYDPYLTAGDADEAHTSGTSSFDNPATKKKPPKLKPIHRSLSMAIENYAPLATDLEFDADEGFIVHEQPLIHRSASPLPVRSSAPPQTLALPTTAPLLQQQQQQQQHIPQQHTHVVAAGGSGSVSPALSARQHHHLQQQQQHHLQQQQQQQQHHQQQQQHQLHMHTFQQLAAQAQAAARHHQLPAHSTHAHQHRQHHPHSSSTSSPTSHAVSPILGQQQQQQHLQQQHRQQQQQPDIYLMKKTHSFHAQQDPAAMEQIQLAVAAGSASSSRRTSSVRANFLMPGPPAGGKEISRSPSPSRRGCRSHRSFNDPGRRPSSKPDALAESQIRHASLNDDLMEPIDNRSLFPQSNLSLENELFVESRSRSNSHTKMEDLGIAELATAAVVVQRMRKSSGSFEETAPGLAAGHSATHPPATSASNSIKQKREPHPHSRQQSTHSLELDGRPSTSSAAAAATHTMHLHSAAAAASAAYHFKRGAQHGRSLYLSPSNLEELTVHRPGVLAAAAAFQGTNASASVKQAKAMHSASVRLRSYREALSASKKSKSFIGEGSGSVGVAGAVDDFELSSPHRRNSRPLSTAVPGGVTGAAVVNVDEIKRSPRPISAAAVAAAFIEEKRPSFERKASLTYEQELSDAAFAAQVLRPFHHKLAAGRKASISGGSHKLKKKSLSDETDEDEEADRKRKRIVCIVLATVLLCLVCASVFVVIVTLTSGQSQSGKKAHSFSRDTPVHYTGMRPS
ncbi:box A-binding factor isoform X2 [Drosophila grimshawi]|uniref:box A-binding factor isoform X2 n=1 Tax=Drosophila grimshawi TaxID=7222 RepID=UPI000C86F8CA|nr:box A-binding factor isoform X2 [Drosophila grimshawi]